MDSRFSTDPTRPRTTFAGALGVALVFGAAGCVSLAFGQDANWDLLNYHLYNPWAFLTDRLDTDLAVAGVSTYVNPLIDVPYYLLIDRLPPRVLAFLMGALQGVNALLLYRLSRRLLLAQSRWLAGFLTLGGVTGSVFLSEFGNTMGDNVTAAFLLAALVLVIADRQSAATDEPRRERFNRVLLAGAIAGVGTGLKLTNAPYAVGLMAAVLASGPARAPIAAGLRFGTGWAIGFAASYGFWAATLWQHFGNPFFPQFNRLFGSPLAAATIVADDKWHPQSWIEAALFPFSFTAFPMRINEVPLVDPLWPVVYALFCAGLVMAAVGRVAGRAGGADAVDRPRTGAITTLFTFVGVAYLLWMLVFSIGRYLVLLELLLPLLAWLLLHRFFRPKVAAWICVTLVSAASLFTVFIGLTSWGNAPFDDVANKIGVPAFTDPSHTSVLVLTAPVAWILPSYPPELAFLALNLGFPDSPAYLARVHETIERRGGAVFAILPVDREPQRTIETVLNPWLAGHGIERGSLPCRYIDAIFRHQPGSDVLLDETPGTDGCRFRRDVDLLPVYDRGARTIALALKQYGFSIHVDRCSILGAEIGAARYRYRFCPVTRTTG